MIQPRSVLHIVSPLLTVALLFAAEARAQEQQQRIQFPDASQRSVLKQRVGLTDIEIDYARPNKNDREVFGGLVPNGKIWRTGANATTRIKFSDTVKIGDKEIAAGEYAIFTIPAANEWTVIFSKDTKAQAGDYKQENDVARVMAKPTSLPASVESFTIGLADVKGATATLHLDWDKTRVPVQVTTDDIEQVSKQLETAASGTTPMEPRMAFQAAVFYMDNGKDMNQALKWIDQALEKNPDAYFMHMRRAQIQAKLGNKKEATASAQKTIEILKKDKEPDASAIDTAQQIIDKAK